VDNYFIEIKIFLFLFLLLRSNLKCISKRNYWWEKKVFLFKI